MHFILPFPSFVKVAACVLCLVSAAASATGVQPSLDTARIEQITGLKGSYSKEGDVFKVARPRTDVGVAVDDWAMPPFMGLGSWAAFTPASGGALVMGDTALFEDEVNPVMSVALEHGLAVTALHNHFFYDKPRVYFMHVSGIGDPIQLAAAIRKMYDKVDEIRKASPLPASVFPETIAQPSNIHPEPLQAIFGSKGMAGNGMFKVVISRHATMAGVAIGKEMGVNTWAAFGGSDDHAVVDGDIVMTEGELQPTLKSLRASGINVVAIHQHMAGEQPRLLFLHYWGKGKAVELARAVKRAAPTEPSRP